MKQLSDVTRRSFLGKVGGLVTASVIIGQNSFLEEANAVVPKEGQKTEEGNAAEISPAEDLMREHGVLSRILLVYEEILGRMKANRSFPVKVLADSAGIIHRFIEDYHERLEEEFLFPRFEKAKKLVDLVKTLREQHQAGRRLTQYIKNRAELLILKNPNEKEQVAKKLRLFIAMYRPHKAREDTILFPAFHSIVPPEEYEKLGDEFEDKEHELFGKEGFEKVVEEVAVSEGTLGIHAIDQFTPKI